VRKISPPPGFDPLTFQPVASRYTNCAIRGGMVQDNNASKKIMSPFSGFKLIWLGCGYLWMPVRFCCNNTIALFKWQFAVIFRLFLHTHLAVTLTKDLCFRRHLILATPASKSLCPSVHCIFVRLEHLKQIFKNLIQCNFTNICPAVRITI